jgi:hypothetical protein
MKDSGPFDLEQVRYVLSPSGEGTLNAEQPES